MKHSKSIILNDFMSSIVVFFVALPLCMGIALASGVPAEYGLISGIIGGLVVGLLSGAPLQVSGPAAGLAVMVFEMVKEYGLVSLFPLGIVVGLTQIVSSYFKLGIFFRATSPSLIKGLLGGIGVLIFSSQFHVMLDDSTKSSGLENLATIPNAFNMVFNDLVSQEIHFAAVLGIITITTIVIWNLLKDKSKATRIIPAPLIAVVVATVLANAYHFPVKLIQLPENLLGNISLENFLGSFSIFSVTFLIKSLGIVFVASAETLLCVTAVDKMVKNGGSNYNKELMAQGVRAL